MVVKGSASHARPSGWGLEELARLRTGVYGVLSMAFLPPEAHRLRLLGDFARSLERQAAMLAELAFYGPWRELLTALTPSLLRDAHLPEEYVRVFCRNPDGPVCFPYASAYLTASGDAPGLLIAEVVRYYATAGLDIAPDAHESPDHVSVELEFMAHLCATEAEAWEARAFDVALHALGQEGDFLHYHLGQWLSTFARAVGRVTTHPLYRAVSETADVFVHHDRDLVDQLLRQLSQSASSPAADSSAQRALTSREV